MFVTASELAASYDGVDRAKSEGYEIVTVPDSIRSAVAGTRDITGNPVRDLGVVLNEWAETFAFSFVDPKSLTSAEQKVFDEWRNIVRVGGGLPPGVEELCISETMRPDHTTREPLGLWESATGRIIIKRSELASIERFGGTLLHELTHARTGFPDVSREFESALTQVIGTVVASTYAG